MKKICLHFEDTDFGIDKVWCEKPESDTESLDAYFIINPYREKRLIAKDEHGENYDFITFISNTIGITETDYKFGFVMQISDSYDNSRKPFFVPVIYTNEYKPEWVLSRRLYNEIEFTGGDIWESNHMNCSQAFKNNALKYAYRSYPASFDGRDLYLDYCTIIEDEKTLRFLHALWEIRLSGNLYAITHTY